ncbi:MAG: peptide-methionine (S)-S-oxide reductase MsrA [Gammaproteobacteria bacterium]|nr:peptide-methionine (S)-S-oxide reductase MsrA [Gammaproteobacteria bacterium]MBU1625214.1 peptide-methionine (S)-S-oxide reductase MsrA [Gammaproteobacteria bacterium]MBU1981474.1 peptide-methionine (S)-S-oxide reductase MsrA [Gammaproteobacteria bacterium]
MNRLSLFILLSLLTFSSHAQPKGATMTDTNQTAYLAGGCFWGMEELVRQIPGVLETEVGYAGGDVPNANYDIVKMGRSGHAESLKIVFDPAKLTYRHLLFEFFRMHNPTTRNQQGNDRGTQYRSAIFYVSDEQKNTAEEVIRTVDGSGEWGAKVVTEVTQFKDFWRAEEYHQKYLVKHPHGYTCHVNRGYRLGE